MSETLLEDTHVYMLQPPHPTDAVTKKEFARLEEDRNGKGSNAEVTPGAAAPAAPPQPASPPGLRSSGRAVRKR